MHQIERLEKSQGNGLDSSTSDICNTKDSCARALDDAVGSGMSSNLNTTLVNAVQPGQWGEILGHT
jgi:hypothetical protein